jgi:hypothetical protein
MTSVEDSSILSSLDFPTIYKICTKEEKKKEKKKKKGELTVTEMKVDPA